MHKVKSNKKLIKQHLEGVTGKCLKMKDIHNCITSFKKDSKLCKDEVEDIKLRLNSFSNLETDFMHNEEGLVTGIFMQDFCMKQDYEAFPEVILLTFPPPPSPKTKKKGKKLKKYNGCI